MNNDISFIQNILTVWTTTRATGLTAYILLSISMVFGILQSYGTLQPKTKNIFYSIHEYTSTFGLFTAALHGFVLIFDKYVGYSYLDLLIPFINDDKPILTGLGILSLYLMLLLVITSDLRHKMNRKVWKTIHYSSVVAFIFALIHGILQGTDTQFAYTQIIYGISGVIVFSLLLGRPRKTKQAEI